MYAIVAFGDFQITQFDATFGRLDEDTIDDKTTTRARVRVVTFDLDNTLWDTTATIDAANDALALYMKDTFNVDARVEKAMGTLYKANKARYAPIEGNDAKSPVLLTQLRKDAIRHVVLLNSKQDNNGDEDDEIDGNDFDENNLFDFPMNGDDKHDKLMGDLLEMSSKSLPSISPQPPAPDDAWLATMQ